MTGKEDIRILAYESSYDEVSTVVTKGGREIESLVAAIQIKSHQRFGEVVPEVTPRHHIEVITQIIGKALNEAKVIWNGVDAIAMTYGPGLVGALLIGVSTAKVVSMATGVPLISVDHIMGHIMATQFEDGIEYPTLALQVSDGHTELVLMHDPINFETIGDTHDGVTGEAYDKIDQVLGVNYPAGKTINTWARQGNGTFNFSRAMFEGDDYDFLFSGLKSASINTCYHADQIGKRLDKYDLAASFQAVVADVLGHKTIQAIKELKPKTFVLGGDVAASRGLRERLEAEIGRLDARPKITIPLMKLCGDNAMMIGAAAYNLYKAGKFNGLDLNVDLSPGLPYADTVLDG